jgi:hypothetical protein
VNNTNEQNPSEDGKYEDAKIEEEDAEIVFTDGKIDLSKLTYRQINRELRQLYATLENGNEEFDNIVKFYIFSMMALTLRKTEY